MLERIRALAIPPAWTDVWICPWRERAHPGGRHRTPPGGASTCTTRRGATRRDREKHDRILGFAAELDGVRDASSATSGSRACRASGCWRRAVRLLDLGFFRIGSEQYAQENETFGLATLRRDHVRLAAGGVLVFDYTAKGGKQRAPTHRRPRRPRGGGAPQAPPGAGDELLAWKDGRRWRDVRSEDVNAYLKEIAGPDVTAKDFRTWNATVLAATAVSVYGRAARSPTARSRAIVQAVREVAHYLGNTPAVCRASYVDPRVFERFESGRTISAVLEELEDLEAAAPDPASRSRIERAVVELISS